MEEDKRCSKCKVLQGMSKFAKDKTKPDGRSGTCKKCRNKAAEQAQAIPVKMPDSKCRCNRSGNIIFKKACVRGCNDLCATCKNPQMQNIPAGGETLTPEEDKERTFTGTYRSSAAIAVEDGYIEN